MMRYLTIFLHVAYNGDSILMSSYDIYAYIKKT